MLKCNLYADGSAFIENAKPIIAKSFHSHDDAIEYAVNLSETLESSVAYIREVQTEVQTDNKNE